MPDAARLIEAAVRHVIESGCRTADIGGTASTGDFGDAVVAYIRKTV